MLPEIVLDDRRFQELVSEARTRIALTCPEWTEHNVSDPGITLIELFAWMTEMLIYRVNRIPDKLHVALLNLLGMRLGTPERATAEVRFSLAGQAEEPVEIPAGAEVATVRTSDDRSDRLPADRRVHDPATAAHHLRGPARRPDQGRRRRRWTGPAGALRSDAVRHAAGAGGRAADRLRRAGRPARDARRGRRLPGARRGRRADRPAAAVGGVGRRWRLDRGDRAGGLDRRVQSRQRIDDAAAPGRQRHPIAGGAPSALVALPDRRQDPIGPIGRGLHPSAGDSRADRGPRRRPAAGSPRGRPWPGAARRRRGTSRSELHADLPPGPVHRSGRAARGSRPRG